MVDKIETTIPGREPIELVSFYEEFRDYYPLCELETKRWFVDHVGPDWWIFDVGANVGYYTILFSRLAPQGRVFAFEPTTTVMMLRENLKHNNVQNAEVHEIALGLTTGDREDRIYRVWGTEGEVKTYPFYRLDDFVSEHAIRRIDCIKIDVDSFDFEVLRGAERTLLRHSPVIVVELNHQLERRKQSVGEALEWLARRGYGKALVLDRYDNFVLQRDPDAFVEQDVVARIELLFPRPVRIDERMPESAGRPLAKAIVKTAALHHGAVAALRTGAKPALRSLLWRLVGGWGSVGHRPAIAVRDIVGVPIETTTVQWDYSLVLSVAPPAAEGTLTLEVGVEVMEGKLGIAVAGEDESRFSVPERVLIAMPGVQHTVIKVGIQHIRSLIFRNAAADGDRTRFTVVSVQAAVA
jgi:FkbM family methyltransferase